MRAPQWLTGNALTRSDPAALRTSFSSPQRSSVISRNFVPAQQIARARRGHDLGDFPEAKERARIEVIEVRVGKQDQINRRQFMKLQRRLREAFRADGEKGQANPDAREKNGIGQDRDSEKIEQHGGVAEPRGRQPIVGPFLRPRPGSSRQDRAATLKQPFAPEMRDPAAAGHG